MFCCSRFVKRVKQIQAEVSDMKSELSEVTKQLEEIQEKQRLTKKNLVKIIDTFTLAEYVLFKTRLLTKKQTLDLLSELYEEYNISEQFRNSDGLQKFQEFLKDDGVDLQEAQHKLVILSEMDRLKAILDKLEDPKLKDSDYALAKAKWCLQDDNSDFLNTVIKIVKML
jgi:hypothetical protein